MKNLYKLTLILAAGLLLFGCKRYKKLIKEEVILKDKNSITGTIMNSDSVTLSLKRFDKSSVNIPWNDIDTIIGKRFKTLWVGFNTGYYNTPYFSVFRNQPINSNSLGFESKIGKAVRGKWLTYFAWTYIPAKPYIVNKWGFGLQQYIIKGTYLSDQSLFWGMEYHLMNAKFNNGVQMCIETFNGYERKLTDQLRIHGKLQVQYNLANKNNSFGVNITVGVHFMKRNFKKHYTTLNKERRLPK